MDAKVRKRTRQDDQSTTLLTTLSLREEMLREALIAIDEATVDGHHHPNSARRAAVVVRCIIRLMPKNVAELAMALGRPRRTIYRWMKEAGLPSPKSWVAAARLTHAVTDLNRERRVMKVSSASRAHGYADQFTLSRQMKRVFGVRPTEARTWKAIDLFKKWLDENVRV